MLRFYFLILMLLGLILPKVSAHESSIYHQDCLKAVDYKGCIYHYQNNSFYQNNLNNGDIWRRYGRILLNSSRWTKVKQNYIAPVYLSAEKPLFIAINCQSRKINISNRLNEWKGWLSPLEQFENVLINDFCNETQLD